MSINDIREFLLYCTLINYGILLIWFGAFLVAHDWIYMMHSRWFKMSAARFDEINYLSIAIYKLGIMVFNLVPLIALYIIR